MIAAGINFSSTTALRFADLGGLSSNNTMGPMNARPLHDVRMNHSKQTREERPGRFLTSRAATGKQVKMFKQVRAPPFHVKERAYPKQVAQEGDAERYGELIFRIDETAFAAYDKAHMKKTKIIVIASSDLVNTPKPLFWLDVVILAGTDLNSTTGRNETNNNCVNWH